MEKDSQISLLQERLSQVNDRDKELERIFDYCYDLNKINMEYKPVLGDKVDNQLADIINNNQILQGKAKMLFVRESEGLYTYCKKKVFMKIS